VRGGTAGLRGARGVRGGTAEGCAVAPAVRGRACYGWRGVGATRG